MGPVRNSSVSSKRSERSVTQPFTANCAGQITSPSMRSMSPPPAWNWVLSLSKYSPVSAGISWYLTLKPLLCLLNFSISACRLPVSSGPQERIRSPESLPPPPHPAVPSSAAPASPAPPSFRKSLRLRSAPNFFPCMFSPCLGYLSPPALPVPQLCLKKPLQARVAFFEQRKLGVLGLLVRLRR